MRLLRRQIKVLQNEYEDALRKAMRWETDYDRKVDQVDPLKKELKDANERLENLQLENAELHGYINRVEIEDDERWHREHGVKLFRVDKDGVAVHDGEKSPLRQRLRGVRYENLEPKDTFTGVPGRPRTRHAG